MKKLFRICGKTFSIDGYERESFFEVAAEVITGLQKAFTDFEAGNEEAWKSK